MEVRFEGDTYAECINQMEAAVDEWNGNEAEAGTAIPGTSAADKPKRTRGPNKNKLAVLTQPPAAVPAAPAPAADKVWHVCQFHVQATQKVGKPSTVVAPHECEGCRVMATGQSFEALLGLGGNAPASAPGTSTPAAPTAGQAAPTGMTAENVKAVMRELVQAKIKATGAKTDAEIEAAAKPIGDWLAANFKTVSGAPCQMASEIQPADYPRFNELALKMAAEAAPKKSMFD